MDKDNELKPINADTLKEAMFLIVKEEAERIRFGKVFVELTVYNSRVTNILAETKRSVNINEGDFKL